jgi:hypothetical protein
MSVERQSEHQERHERVDAELEAARVEKMAELSRQPEVAPDHQEQRAEAAREVIKGPEIAPEPPPAPEAETKAPARNLLFIDHKINYRETLASVQRKLSPVSRSFSQVIHTPAVEKTAEVLERTVARPSVVLGATWTALIVGSMFYLIARHYGYALSGSELLFSFVIGALIGLTAEALFRLARPNQQP